jgi:hypothetical protein
MQHLQEVEIAASVKSGKKNDGHEVTDTESNSDGSCKQWYSSCKDAISTAHPIQRTISESRNPNVYYAIRGAYVTGVSNSNVVSYQGQH